MNNLWKDYKYLCLPIIGWAAFFVLQLMRTPLTFWLGAILGIVFAIVTIVSSVSRLSRTTKHVVLHGIAWTLAIALGLLSAVYIYAVLTF